MPKILAHTTLIFITILLISSCIGLSIPDKRSSEAKLYASKCNACHKAPDPDIAYYSQWERLILLMQRKINHKDMAPLSEQEWNIISAYIKKHAALEPPEEEKPPLVLPESLR
jgi:hypothetical protein